MITATELELRAGAHILLEPTTLRVQPGDRIGLVGRNGAGKTTSLRTFAGETLPHAGRIDRTGPVGYLPQDPRTGDLTVLARDRVLSARRLAPPPPPTRRGQGGAARRPPRRAAEGWRGGAGGPGGGGFPPAGRLRG